MIKINQQKLNPTENNLFHTAYSAGYMKGSLEMMEQILEILNNNHSERVIDEIEKTLQHYKTFSEKNI